MNAWSTTFASPADFRDRSIAIASLAVHGRKELKRATDRATGTPWCPWNIRLYRQTYHGLRLLKALAGQDVAILPWDAPDVAPVRVLEICPAATLHSAGLYGMPYKRGGPEGFEVRTRLLGDICSRWPISLEPEVIERVEADSEGDAMDAILAVVSTAFHAAALTPAAHARIRAEANLLEGHVYSDEPTPG